jgi:hypothetical protein
VQPGCQRCIDCIKGPGTIESNRGDAFSDFEQNGLILHTVSRDIELGATKKLDALARLQLNKPSKLRFDELSLTNELFNCYRDGVGRVVMEVVTGIRKSEPPRDSHCRCALLHDLRKVGWGVRSMVR